MIFLQHFFIFYPEERFMWVIKLIAKVVQSGSKYTVTMKNKGKVIKGVINDKLDIDVRKHINAKNRFKDYGDMDILFEYFISSIERSDNAGLVKSGDNIIRTAYGRDNKLLEIRFRVTDGKLYSINAFPGHSDRNGNNVTCLIVRIGNILVFYIFVY